jgi:hypothetical protein
MLLSLIVACEVTFWLFLLLGLWLRYALQLRRTGAVVLAGVPLIDVVLLIATALHLRSGASPDLAAGLAAVYIGVSVAFGPSIIRRMDARFAHRFGRTPAPPGRPAYGKERARHEWREFRKAALAWAISVVLLLAGTVLAGGLDAGAPLLGWIAYVTLVLLIWLIWPVTYTLWPAKPKPEAARSDRTRA